MRRSLSRKSGPRRYSEDLGWRRRHTPIGTIYTGLFRARGLSFHGWARQDPDGKLHFLIYRPPIEILKDTDFSGCFHEYADGWQLVAFKPYAQPPNVDSGIAAIQKALLKAFAIRAAKRNGARP